MIDLSLFGFSVAIASLTGSIANKRQEEMLRQAELHQIYLAGMQNSSAQIIQATSLGNSIAWESLRNLYANQILPVREAGPPQQEANKLLSTVAETIEMRPLGEKCEQCGEVSSADVWKSFGGFCPKCGQSQPPGDHPIFQPDHSIFQPDHSRFEREK